jgi:hypothetical protein
VLCSNKFNEKSYCKYCGSFVGYKPFCRDCSVTEDICEFCYGRVTFFDNLKIDDEDGED